jgi:hypothetical protein
MTDDFEDFGQTEEAESEDSGEQNGAVGGDSNDSGDVGGADWDLDAEWAAARIEAGHAGNPFDYPTHEYEFLPMFLLYVGLFLGPLSPFVFAGLLLKRLMTLRGALIMLSSGAACWLALQGFTWMFSEEWTAFPLQLMRSSLNFGAGLVAFLVVRSETKSTHVRSRGTIFNTVIALVVALAVFFMVPKPWLMVLGR